jgi:hypothetical protein
LKSPNNGFHNTGTCSEVFLYFCQL